jgi:hypothetical protein
VSDERALKWWNDLDPSERAEVEHWWTHPDDDDLPMPATAAAKQVRARLIEPSHYHGQTSREVRRFLRAHLGYRAPAASQTAPPQPSSPNTSPA